MIRRPNRAWSVVLATAALCFSFVSWGAAQGAAQPPAEKVFKDLEGLGISVPDACRELLEAGVKAFSGSLDSLFQILTQKRAAVLEAAVLEAAVLEAALPDAARPEASASK